MKLKHYLALIPVGILASYAFAAPQCASEIKPCTGTQTQNGSGCSTGCPPSTLGCCQYIEYRVNCNVGPDQVYRVRECFNTKKCKWIVIPEFYECTHL